jgi:hypothetical protein
MADQYYFSHDGNPFGPFSATQLRGMAAGGRIGPTDLVWKEGTGQKVAAARVKNLFAVGEAVAAPQPPRDAAPARETPSDPQTPATAIQGTAFGRDPEVELVKEAAATSPPEPPREQADRQPPPRPAYEEARREPEKPRPKRVVSIRGGILTGQDGVRVQFRKKCETCGHEDNCRSTILIRLGACRVPFFCRKCRRARTVEMTAVY